MSNPPPLRINQKHMFLLKENWRFKCLYGGRAGGKSWDCAKSILVKCLESKLRVLCCREVQKSIDDSVHALFTDTISEQGWESLFIIKKTSIICKSTGSEISYSGLANAASLKSFEGADICWIEEAAGISKRIWTILIPTIRKPGSEIWITFNPEFDSDETYQRFVVNPPSNCKTVNINYDENPFCPDVMLQEALNCKYTRSVDEYNNIWLGKTIQVLDGSVYAAEFRDAMLNNRITKVPYEMSKPVDTFWDIGYADYTAIWFAQWVGFELRVIDFYQDRMQNIEHYIKVIKDKKYLYGTDYLPHDAKHKTIAGAGKSIADQMTDAGRTVEVLNPENKTTSISAVRNIFHKCYFDEAKTAEGLNSLKRYRYKVDESTGLYSRIPVHDNHSHAADAFAILAMNSNPTIKGFQQTQALTDYDVFSLNNDIIQTNHDYDMFA